MQSPSVGPGGLFPQKLKQCEKSASNLLELCASCCMKNMRYIFESSVMLGSKRLFLFFVAVEIYQPFFL